MIVSACCSNTPAHQLGDHVNVKRPFRSSEAGQPHTARAANSLNRSYSQDLTASVMSRSYIQDPPANIMNRSYTQDPAVNGGARSAKKGMIGSDLMSRSLLQESAQQRRSIDESLALIKHHVQVG
jgi:hypothetical protein